MSNNAAGLNRMAGDNSFQQRINRASQPIGDSFLSNPYDEYYKSRRMDRREERMGRRPERRPDRRRSYSSNGAGNFETNPYDEYYKSRRMNRRMNRRSQETGGDFSNMPVEGSSPYDIDSNEFMERFSSKNRALSERGSDPDVNRFIDNARRNNPIDIVAMDHEIRNRPTYHEAKAKVAEANLFGDVDRWKYEQAPEWTMPVTPPPVEKPDFDAMYERSRDDLAKLKI